MPKSSNKKLIQKNSNSNSTVNMKEDTSTPHNLLNILNQLLETTSYSDIAKELNVAIGTVKRWNELRNVPKSYTFELLKLANINIDYTKFKYKDKDQFFTPVNTAKYCYDKFIEVLNKYNDDEKSYTFIEPSAGDGKFLKLLPPHSRIYLLLTLVQSPNILYHPSSIKSLRQ